MKIHVNITDWKGTLTKWTLLNYVDGGLDNYGFYINDSVKNYIDYENKKYIQKVGKYTFTGNETITQGTILNGDYRYLISLPNSKAITADIMPNIIFSDDSYEIRTANVIYQGNVGVGISSNGSFNFYDSNIQSLTDFKAFISGKNIYYELETPIETDLSDYL